jgi:hypothetical protein
MGFKRTVLTCFKLKSVPKFTPGTCRLQVQNNVNTEWWGLILFIYDLFNYALNNSAYREWSGRQLGKEKLSLYLTD